MSSLKIRLAERGDIAAIAEWNRAMAWETEQKRLDPQVLLRGVTAVLDEPRRGFYLVAELDGKAAGCLLVTYEWSDWLNGDFWWFQSVYVTPEARVPGDVCRGGTAGETGWRGRLALVCGDGEFTRAADVSGAGDGAVPLLYV